MTTQTLKTLALGFAISISIMSASLAFANDAAQSHAVDNSVVQAQSPDASAPQAPSVPHGESRKASLDEVVENSQYCEYRNECFYNYYGQYICSWSYVCVPTYGF
jgi:hypothetical protein